MLQGTRDPTRPELNATAVLALDMEEVSAKVLASPSCLHMHAFFHYPWVMAGWQLAA